MKFLTLKCFWDRLWTASLKGAVLRALILGGTKGLGLGLALAEECRKRGIVPIIAGRSASADIKIDLTDESPFGELKALLEKGAVEYLFWVAGIFYRGPFAEMSAGNIDAMIATHLSGPLRVLQLFHSSQKRPYHLIVIASISSWRLRDNETLYCALKAAKASFARNFAKELLRERPGSRVTLVNPGGIKTPFWRGTSQDTSGFMEPSVVASLILKEIQNQQDSFKEIQIIRGEGGSPILEKGSRMPETP